MLDRETALRISRLAAALKGMERALADAYIADPLSDLGTLGLRAGYCAGIKDRVKAKNRAMKQAFVALKRARVKAYIAAIMAAGEQPEDTAIVKHIVPLIATADEVKQRLTRISRASLTDVMRFDDQGQWTGEFTFTRDGSYCLREIQVDKVTRGENVYIRVKPKIDDRLRALQVLAQIHGLVRQPEDARRDEVVAAAWAKVFALHPEVAKAYHFALLEQSTEIRDVTPVPVNGSGRVHG